MNLNQNLLKFHFRRNGEKWRRCDTIAENILLAPKLYRLTETILGDENRSSTPQKCMPSPYLFQNYLSCGARFI